MCINIQSREKKTYLVYHILLNFNEDHRETDDIIKHVGRFTERIIA